VAKKGYKNKKNLTMIRYDIALRHKLPTQRTASDITPFNALFMEQTLKHS
jgi:hypothetical protein